MIYNFVVHFCVKISSRMPRALSLEVKRPEREADSHLHLAPSLRMRRAVPPPPIRLHGVVLSSAQGQLCICIYIYRF